MPQLLSNDDLDLDLDLDLNLDLDLTSNSHNLCPYCDEVLPDILPEKIQNQLQNLQNKLITAEERLSFCIMHHAELNIVPHGLSKGYPEYIDFDQLSSRMIKFEKDLFDVINGNVSSYYRNIAISIYEEIEYNKAMMLTNRCELFQVSNNHLFLFKILFYIILINSTNL